MLMVTGVVCSMVAPFGTSYFYNKWKTKERNKVSSYRGEQIIYATEEGDLKRGEVIGYDGYEGNEYTEMNLTGETTPIIFKDIVARLIPDHRDLGRVVEMLTESDDHQAIFYVGHVVDVFDNGFYELELLAKTGLLPDSLSADATTYDMPYIDIEPRRIIINKNVSLVDGGFKLASRGNRQALWVRKINRRLQLPQIKKMLLVAGVASNKALLRQREHELLLESAQTGDADGQDHHQKITN